MVKTKRQQRIEARNRSLGQLRAWSGPGSHERREQAAATARRTFAGVPKSPEQRARMSEAQKEAYASGRKHRHTARSPALRKAQLRRFEDPMQIANLRGQSIRLWATPEYRKKMMERFTCDECGFESSRLGIGRHQGASGHQGRTPVEPPTLPDVDGSDPAVAAS